MPFDTEGLVQVTRIVSGAISTTYTLRGGEGAI